MQFPKPTAQVLPTHTPAAFDAAVEAAATLLRAGEVVAVPTETVYGLAANALDPAAVARIYQVKGRPSHNPIIIHVASVDLARQCVREWNPLAQKLSAAFWPGPLTLVLPRADSIPGIVTAGGETVGVRWPSHPFIQALIRRCGFPLAAPSANRSNEISPTQAGHVLRQLGDRIPLIIDGGHSQVGIESTVLDVTTTPARVLRPGMICAESLASVAGDVQAGGYEKGVLRSPGQLPRHYAPKARLLVRQWEDDGELMRHVAEAGVAFGDAHVLAHTRIPAPECFGRVAVIPHDPEAFARALYAELHRCDELGARVIVVEAPPGDGQWTAVADRLQRAGR